METARIMAAQDAEVVPRLPTAAVIRAFDKYCVRNAGNPGRTVAALKDDGYRYMVSFKRDNLYGYVRPNGPFVGVDQDRSQPGCMVMVYRDPQLGRAFDTFVNSRHRNAVEVTPTRGLDRAWIVAGDRRELIYSRAINGTDEMLLVMVRQKGS